MADGRLGIVEGAGRGRNRAVTRHRDQHPESGHIQHCSTIGRLDLSSACPARRKSFREDDMTEQGRNGAVALDLATRRRVIGAASITAQRLAPLRGKLYRSRSPSLCPRQRSTPAPPERVGREASPTENLSRTDRSPLRL